MATILLESLLATTAASSAACQPRHNGFTSHCNSPHLRPYRHLWPTHSCTPHASSPPLSSIHDITLHTAAAAHTATTGTTVTARVPTSTTTTTPHSRPSHSTAIDLQAQPTTTARSSSNHFPTSLPPTSTTTWQPLFPPFCAPATNGASAKISTFPTASSTSKKRSNGRKAAPSSHTSSPSVAIYSASPAVPLTLSFNTFTPNIPAKCLFPNFGAISTATLPKPHQTSHCTPPTMTWSASLTRSHNTDSSMQSTLSFTTGNNSNPHTP